MGSLHIVKAGSRSGRRAVARMVARGDEIFDARTVEKTRKIVERVRHRGDRALLDSARRHDGVTADSVEELRLHPETITSASEDLPSGFAEGLERSMAAVERFHRPQVREGYRLEDSGMTVEERRSPLGRVGIYCPGGRAAYPSTLVMTVIPARLAGVPEIAVVTPRRTYDASAPLRYTLQRLGVEEIWGLGGAHGIAALAYGTETIRSVDKIVGPGNAWVTAAKLLVSRDVAVDGLSGPTEVVILATEEAPPELVAADLLAQAEHDPLAAAVLVTPSKPLAKEVRREIDRQLALLPPETPARASLKRFGVAFLVEELEEGVTLVNTLAPEHLQLVGTAAEALADRTFLAGGVFVGAATPEVFGDYVAGPNHVLPTCGTARWASALGVEDFVRRWQVVQCSPGAASRWAAAAVAMAEAEGLPAHAASAVRRLQ
jgi:histidinol dehydrogenase